MTFTGFSRDGLEFLSDLGENNNREWFQSHKSIYQSEVEQPAKFLMAELSDRIEAKFSTKVTPKIFRIYRDVRFSKDKTPYNTHIRMAFFDKSNSANGRTFYISIEPNALCLGLGCMKLDGSRLEQYRAAVLDDKTGDELARLLDELTKGGFRLREPGLKRVPRGVDKNHPREKLLRRKGLAVWYDGSVDEVTGSDTIQNCLTQYQRMVPLYEWLGKIDS